MSIQSDVGHELGAWVAARRAVKVAENLLQDDPSNPTAIACLEQAQAGAKEAGALLRAALAAKGYSFDQLQQELRASA